MSPGGLPCLSPDHYLACLIIHLSLVFYPFRRQILREVFLTLPREKEFLSRGWGIPGSARGRGVRTLSFPPMNATHALAKNLSRTPPVVQNHIPGTQIHSPENFRKFGKVAFPFCGGIEIYLTNEGNRCNSTHNSEFLVWGEGALASSL